MDKLYHTTSLRALPKILREGILRGHPFVSFGAVPWYHDITGNDAVIVMDRAVIGPRVIPVVYTRQWYDRHPEHAAYVAGEGWREQYQEPDECYDEYGEPDDECLEQDYREAELQAFLDKSRERELISRIEGDLKIPKGAVMHVMASRRKLDAVRSALINVDDVDVLPLR